MSSVTRAMLWEFWRLSRLELLTRLGYTCGFIVLIWSMVRFTKSEQIPVQFVTSISMVFVFCGAAFSSAVVKIENSDVGSVFQLGFSRPVSTRSLVVWRLIFLAVTGAVCYLVPVALVRILTGVQLPIISPLLVVATLMTAMVCAAWSSSNGIGRIVAVSLVLATFVAACVLFYFSRREPDVPVLFIIGRPEFLTLSWYHHLALLLTCAAAIAVCVRSVDAQRHGDKTWFGIPLRDRRRATEVRKPTEVSSLLSKHNVRQCRAEFWRLWRQCRSLLVIVTVMTLFVAAYVTSMQLARPNWLHGPNVWLIALLLSPLIAQLIAAELAGSVKSMSGVTQLSVYDAVQPIRADFATGMKLLLITVLSATAWLIAVGIASLQLLWAGDVPSWERILGGLYRIFATVGTGMVIHVIAAIAASFFLSSAAMLSIGPMMALIKDRYTYASTVVGAVLLGVWLVDSKYDLQLDIFWNAMQLIGTGIGVLISIGIVHLTIRRRCIGRIYGAAAVVASVVVISGLWRVSSLAVGHSPVPISAWQLTTIAAGITFAVPAMVVAPVLALCLHRHK